MADATTDSDRAIDFKLHQFTVRQTSALTRVSETLIRQWEERQALRIGRRVKFRLRFSVLDLIQLTTMFYLCVRLGITAPSAARIASACAGMADDITRDPETGGLVGSTLGNCILVGFDADGFIMVGPANIRHPAQLPPDFEDDPESPLRWPHVIVPVDAIRRNVIERLSIFDKDAK